MLCLVHDKGDGYDECCAEIWVSGWDLFTSRLFMNMMKEQLLSFSWFQEGRILRHCSFPAATSALDIEDGKGCARIARERLHVLHINHQLRGVDAEEDEEFVRGLSARYGVPCTVESVDVEALAKQHGDNVENVGREVRYAAAARLANELSAQMGCPRSAARIFLRLIPQ